MTENNMKGFEMTKRCNGVKVDNCQIDFPLPRLKDNPDITVIGSDNGVEREKVLEAACFYCIDNNIDALYINGTRFIGGVYVKRSVDKYLSKDSYWSKAIDLTFDNFDDLSFTQKVLNHLLYHIFTFEGDVIIINDIDAFLNAQYHRAIVKTIIKYHPKSQIILSTFSEDVMGSVERDRRMMLTRE